MIWPFKRNAKVESVYCGICDGKHPLDYVLYNGQALAHMAFGKPLPYYVATTSTSTPARH